MDVRRVTSFTRQRVHLSHAGVYVGPVRFADGRYVEHAVVHNSKALGGVVVEPWESYCPSGARCAVVQRAVPGTEDLVVQRALALVGKTYDLLHFNCEHAASLAQTGAATSPQLRGWGAGLLALGAAALFGPALASRVANGPVRYDARADRNRYMRSGRFARG